MSLRHPMRTRGWSGVVGSAVEHSAGEFLSDSAPLLEEEVDAGGFASVSEVADPLFLHGACAGAALAADDHPGDSFQIDVAEVFQQWLDRKEPDGGRRVS